MRKEEKEASDEVEQLLQSAQDELLLKLSVDSHMSRVSPDYLLPDLHRRFQALKSKPTSSVTIPKSRQPQQPPPPPPPPPPHQDDDDPHHLFARFAALKHKASSSDSTTTATVTGALDSSGCRFDCGDSEEDEVEKILRWAKDAARLDPSPPSDVDDDSDDDDDDDDDDVPHTNRK